MPESDDFARLAGAKYLSLTTFRRNGDPVPNPMWAAESHGRLLMTTNGSSAKVRRLRNDPSVRLAECDMRGNVVGGTRTVDGTAEILEGPDVAEANSAVRGKYGIQAALLEVWGWTQRTGLRRPSDRVGIAVTLGDQPD